MTSAVSSGIMINSGRILENIVFIALRRVSTEIFYYKTKNGREVDFIAQMENRSRVLVQVCESLSNPKTKQREVQALTEAMVELGLKEGLIVTRQDQEILEMTEGNINVIPAWRFLISLSDGKSDE